MKVLWITWKDELHPQAGGAEVVCREITNRLLKDGHSVTLLTSRYPDSQSQSNLNGLDVIRVGKNRYTHPPLALFYYLRKLRNKFDVVVEEVEGGAPYFSVFFGGKSRKFIFYHQLARINWLYEIKKPISYIGYFILVPAATRLLSLSNKPVITVSESTRKELSKFGFKSEKISIISEGLHIEPVQNPDKVKKFQDPTVLSHGSMRAMKRTLDQVKAFELAKKSVPNLKMKISGDSVGKYGKSVLRYIANSPYKKDIEYLGRTSDKQKIDLMQKCHMIIVTSVEEGWGLIVTETNSQGTPAVVYDVDGLRDSVRNFETGLITKPTPKSLSDGILMILKNKNLYGILSKSSWEWSKEITFDKCYEDFIKILEAV